MKKYQIFLSDFFFHFLVAKFSVYLNRRVFVMYSSSAVVSIVLSNGSQQLILRGTIC